MATKQLLLLLIAFVVILQLSKKGDTVVRPRALESLSSESMSSPKHANHSSPTNRFINSTTNDQSVDESKVYFIMHVGPPKTGTTTIQCLLNELRNVSSISNQLSVLETESCRPDNEKTRQLRNFYNITPTKEHKHVATYDSVRLGSASLPLCLKQWGKGGGGMPECWNDSYLRVIREQQQHGRSTIVSNEIMVTAIAQLMHNKTQFLDDLVASLEQDEGSNGQKKERIQLVVITTYRRWFEWAKSLHAQGNQQGVRPQLSRWPQMRGRAIPTVESFLLRKMNDPSYGFAFIDAALLFFSGHPRVDLRVINFHQDADMGEMPFAESFFCNALPTTTHAKARGEEDTGNRSALCKAVQDRSAEEHRNPSKGDYFWADQLAIAAQESGLVPITASRIETVKKILFFGSGPESPPLSLVCPSQETYDKILDKSLEYERMVAPYLLQKSSSLSYSSSKIVKMELQHRDEFQRFIRQNELCSLNTTAVLEDEKWRSFLVSIE